MKVLVTGAKGRLGPYLVNAFKEAGHTVSETCRTGCDLTNRASVSALINGIRPDVVVHAAALTDVDMCEREPDKALDINRNTAFHLAEQLSPQAKLVYISTDMAYGDESIPGPYREYQTYPLNMYARSKIGGERGARVNPKHLILRTNFFGPTLEGTREGRHSFSEWVMQSLKNGATEVFYNDVWFSPLHAKTLSTLIVELVESDVVGLFNVGSREGMSKAGFAREVAKHKALDFGKAAVGPAHFRTPRPKDMRLDCTKLATYGWTMPTLEEEIKKL